MKRLLDKIKRRFTKKIIVPTTITVQSGQYLQGKKALIFGGSGGIGSSIAKQYVSNGCQVIISGTNKIKLQSICEEIGHDISYIVMDIRNISSIKEGITKSIIRLGEIDILVNAAGVHGDEGFGNVSEQTYDKVMDINLKAMFFVCQEISNYMIKNKIKGHILNISSSSCTKPAWTPYELSKWGVRGFTLGLADTLIPFGIVVNSIAPGPVATKMINKEFDDLNYEANPAGRVAMPEEIANLAVFMVSGAGDLIVGDTYFISGGAGVIKLQN